MKDFEEEVGRMTEDEETRMAGEEDEVRMRANHKK